jgi:hypothetical protein
MFQAAGATRLLDHVTDDDNQHAAQHSKGEELESSCSNKGILSGKPADDLLSSIYPYVCIYRYTDTDSTRSTKDWTDFDVDWTSNYTLGLSVWADHLSINSYIPVKALASDPATCPLHRSTVRPLSNLTTRTLTGFSPVSIHQSFMAPSTYALLTKVNTQLHP